MTNHPTPTAGGVWRVVDGKLFNEDEQVVQGEGLAENEPAVAAPTSNQSKPGRVGRQSPQNTEE